MKILIFLFSIIISISLAFLSLVISINITSVFWENEPLDLVTANVIFAIFIFATLVFALHLTKIIIAALKPISKLTELLDLIFKDN